MCLSLQTKGVENVSVAADKKCGVCVCHCRQNVQIKCFVTVDKTCGECVFVIADKKCEKYVFVTADKLHGVCWSVHCAMRKQ